MKRFFGSDRGSAWAIRGLSLVLVILVAGNGFVSGQGKGPKNSSDVVKASLKAEPEKPGANGQQTVTVTLEIDKGWHLYANPVGNDMLKDSQTVVSLTSKAPPKFKVEYPDGKLVKDKDVGDYKIYENKVALKVAVNRAAGDKEPVEVIVKVHACNDRSCLAPGTVKLTLP